MYCNYKTENFPIYIYVCGYAKCQPLHNFGPAVCQNYIFRYILKGRGWYFLLYRVQTYYEADRDEPWTYLWIGFAGEKAGEYLRDIGLSREMPVFQCECKEGLERIILSMLEKKNYTVSNEYFLEGILYQFFFVLVQHCYFTFYLMSKTGYF